MQISTANKRRKRTTRTTLALLLSSAAAMTAASDALAGDFAYTTSYSDPGTGLAIEVYEYRNVPNTARSLAPALACTGYTWDTAPLMVVFGGSAGTGYDYTGFYPIAEKVNAKACTRVVYVRMANATGYGHGTGTPNAYAPAEMVYKSAANVEWAMNKVLTATYPRARRVTYVGGSASALFGAKLLERKFSEMIQPFNASAPWSRVKRFIFSGPPAGNLATACRNTFYGVGVTNTIDGVANGLTGKGSCAGYLNFLRLANLSDDSGKLYGWADSNTKLLARNAGLRINMVIGRQDELFGSNGTGCTAPNPDRRSCWTGPLGVLNYMFTTNLEPDRWGGVYPSMSVYVNDAITYSPINATHGDVWGKPDVVRAFCYLAAKEASSMYPSSEGTYLAQCD